MPPLTRQGTLDSLELRAARSPKPAPPPCARAGESRAGLSWQRLLLVLLLAASPLAAQTEPRPAAPNERRAVIIDTDPGTDDAMAILLALSSPELDVRAFTVVPGNVTADQALDNALRLVSLAGRCDVPVAGGARRPLAQKLITAEFVHGENGLAGIELPAALGRLSNGGGTGRAAAKGKAPVVEAAAKGDDTGGEATIPPPVYGKDPA